MGWIHAKEGRKEEAQQMLVQLQKRFPKAHYQQAMIQTALGKQEEAMSHLIKAFEDGLGYSNTAYDFEYAFRPLWEYAPFVEMFVKPKG